MSLKNPQIIVLVEESTDTTMFDCKWVPCSTRFVTLGSEADGSGSLSIYSFKGKELQLLTKYKSAKPFKCGTFHASSLEDRHLATGDFEGNLDLWDLESLGSPISRLKAHTDMINAIDGAGGGASGKGAPEIATASRDGVVKVWDIRIKDRPVACMRPKESEKRRDCWTVSFGHSYSDEARMIAAGYDNGDLKMFDLRTMSVYWETHLPNGICHAQFDRRDIEMNKLVVACLEGKFHTFDLRTKHPKKGFAELTHSFGERTTLWNVAHLPQNRDVFMISSGSGSLTLWEYKYPSSRVKVSKDGIKEGVLGELKKLQDTTVGDQPVNSLDWSAEKIGLGLCTAFDKKIRIIITTKLNTL